MYNLIARLHCSNYCFAQMFPFEIELAKDLQSFALFTMQFNQSNVILMCNNNNNNNININNNNNNFFFNVYYFKCYFSSL